LHMSQLREWWDTNYYTGGKNKFNLKLTQAGP
jgi:hypothetical protein